MSHFGGYHIFFPLARIERFTFPPLSFFRYFCFRIMSSSVPDTFPAFVPLGGEQEAFPPAQGADVGPVPPPPLPLPPSSPAAPAAGNDVEMGIAPGAPQKKARAKVFRGWCATWYFNDLTAGGWSELPDAVFRSASARIKYMVWQLERCPDTDRLHLQGYLEFKNPVSLATVKKVFHFAGNPHFEYRKWTQAAAIAYCKKEETRVEGTQPREWGMAARLVWSLPF